MPLASPTQPKPNPANMRPHARDYITLHKSNPVGILRPPWVPVFLSSLSAMTGLTQCFEVAFLVSPALGNWYGVVYFCCRNNLILLFAVYAERISSKIHQSKFLPTPCVLMLMTCCIVLSPAIVGLVLPVSIAILSNIDQVRTRSNSTWFFKFVWHNLFLIMW